jgi:hypothetical protein
VSNRIGRPEEMELTRDMFERPFDPRKLNRRSGGGVGRVHCILTTSSGDKVDDCSANASISSMNGKGRYGRLTLVVGRSGGREENVGGGRGARCTEYEHSQFTTRQPGAAQPSPQLSGWGCAAMVCSDLQGWRIVPDLGASSRNAVRPSEGLPPSGTFHYAAGKKRKEAARRDGAVRQASFSGFFRCRE